MTVAELRAALDALPAAPEAEGLEVVLWVRGHWRVCRRLEQVLLCEHAARADAPGRPGTYALGRAPADLDEATAVCLVAAE